MYETLDGENMEVAVNADGPCTHDRPKERYLAFHTCEKRAVVVASHQDGMGPGEVLATL
jgi:hypothetical protein